jgi:hypothetical protein
MQMRLAAWGKLNMVQNRGNAANVSLDARVGGCWKEQIERLRQLIESESAPRVH